MNDAKSPFPIYVGCAGWQLPKSMADRFDSEGPHLARYASRLMAVEINTSFYSSHRLHTWRRWWDTTPPDFRFAVKMPRWITHYRRLTSTEGLSAFLEQVACLGDKLGPLLVQLPPKLALDTSKHDDFFATLRGRHTGPVVCEPRHESWYTDEGERMLRNHQVARVAVDPSQHPGDDTTGGWPGVYYVRLHGYPKRFYSSYEDAFLKALANRLRKLAAEAETWCIFNNTARDGGLSNALLLRETLAA